MLFISFIIYLALIGEKKRILKVGQNIVSSDCKASCFKLQKIQSLGGFVEHNLLFSSQEQSGAGVTPTEYVKSLGCLKSQWEV